VGIVALRIKPRLLLKLPDRYQGVDSNDPRPGSETEFYRAHGMFFLGNDRKTRTELYQSEEDVRTHFLVIGGTGAGKTEAMLGMAANLLLWGSGFSYTDGKGDSALWTKAFALLRACGREDDLYVINYMTGSTTVDPDALIEHRLTNTFNPFALGSADSLTQLLVSLMPEAGGDSAPWKQKAIGLLTALMMILHSMRERGLDEQGRPFVLDVSALRTYVTLDALIDLYLRARYRVDGFEVTATAFGALKGYLESVPGFQDPERLWGQAERTPLTAEVIRERRYPTQPEQQAYVQHGYLQNQFTRIFGQLADVYGYIYRVQLGEIDFADVVLNRRVLIVMLPALEKSPDELSSLGKIIIASLKTMLAVGLGSRLEGTHREVIDNKPIQAPAPFLSINDEYGYYAVKGFAVVPAQARSIGFAVCFGGQDTPSFGKESKEEAAAVFGNTLTKIAMRIEDAGESFELFQKTAGEVLVTQTGGFARHENAWLSGYYHDTHSATVEKRNRIDLLDIREQRPGQAHIFYGSTMIRAELFFAAVPPVRAYRLNRFIQVQPQAADAIRDNQRSMSPDAIREGIQQILRMPNGLLDSLHIPSNADLAALRRERSNVRFANGIIAYLLDT
jgi:intracellular multiplication protein IcmO